AFFEPRIGLRRKVRIHQLVCVLVEHHLPGVLDRHIEQDKSLVFSTYEQPVYLGWFSMPKRGALTHLFGVAEGHDLQWDGKAHLCLDHQRAEYTTHLLKVQGHLATPPFAGVG